jgi:acetyltransferase AlgX (SGNH hydrolase-like protein)/GDSL-like lipase/acylhydrolase family protein
MRRLVARVGLIAVGMMVGVLAFEGAVRLFVPVSDLFWQWDPVVGTRLLPNKRGRAVKPGLFDVMVTTNSHGFRDRERSFGKPAGTNRILLLGDSMIEAVQVPFDQSIAALLEDQLVRGGLKAETINLGVSGLGTAREYLMLKEYGSQYEPDLVLLFFIANDVRNNSARLEAVPSYPYPIADGAGSLARDEAGRPRFTPISDGPLRFGVIRRWLGEYSKSYRLLRNTVPNSPWIHRWAYRLGLMTAPPEEGQGRPTDFGSFEVYRAQSAPAWEEAWRMTENMLLETAKLAVTTRARFAVILVPHPWEVYPDWWEEILANVPAMRGMGFDLDKPSREFAALLERHRIPYVNLLPEFRRRQADSPPLYIKGDGHWTAAGHRLAAQLIAGFVRGTLSSGRTSAMATEASVQ